MTPIDFRALFESLPGLCLVLRPNLEIVGATDAYLQATMTRRDEIVGRPLFEVFPDNPDDPEATGVRNLRASLERVLGDRVSDTMAVQKYDIRTAGSEQFEERFWSPTNSPVFAPDGSIAFIIHRVEDVTELVRIRRSEGKRSAELLDRIERMELEVLGRSLELQRANERLRAANEALQKSQDELRGAHDELELRVEERTRALSRSQEQLRHAQKMEAIGRLAGGIAHDFNNLLMVINGLAELLLDAPRDAATTQASLREIKRAGERAADLTRQLLTFSRKQILQPVLVDLRVLVSDINRMLRRLIGEDITLTTVCTAEPWPIRADPGQIEQAIMNLAVNARDAMPDGGELTFEIGNVEFPDEVLDPQVTIHDGRHVMLAISDTGCGMDRETLERLYEPFFTTKDAGKGTGLGMAMVYGIVQQSGGAIHVYSEVGKGTTFKIYLPAAVESTAATASDTDRERPTSGTERILLVEDEVPVRSVIASTLREHGYFVHEADGGEQALRTASEHAGRIDLLITDLVMPGLSGREVAERVVADDRRVRVLFMSGYTDDAIVRHGLLESSVPFLQKPFSLTALAQKVREVLDD